MAFFFHGLKFKISKILNFRKSEFKICCMSPKSSKLNGQIPFEETETKLEKLILPSEFSILRPTSASKSWIQE